MNNYIIFIYYLCSFGVLLQLIRSIKYFNKELKSYIDEFDTTNLDKSYINELNTLKSKTYEITVRPIKTIKKLIITNILISIIIIFISIPLFFINFGLINIILLLEILLIIIKNLYSIKYLLYIQNLKLGEINND